MNHLIHRQELQVELFGEDSPFTVQARLRDWFQQQLFPIIEQTFDKFSTQEELIIIERLEIDLGRFTKQELDNRSVVRSFQQSLEEALMRKLGKYAKQQPEKISISEHYFQQWLSFLETGVRPWQARERTGEEASKVLAFLQKSKKAQSQLRALALRNQRVVERLVYQYPNDEWTDFLAIVSGVSRTELSTQITQLAGWLNATAPAETTGLPTEKSILAFRKWITQQILTQSASNTTNEELLVKLFIEQLSLLEQRQLATLFIKEQKNLALAWKKVWIEIQKRSPELALTHQAKRQLPLTKEEEEQEQLNTAKTDAAEIPGKSDPKARDESGNNGEEATAATDHEGNSILTDKRAPEDKKEEEINLPPLPKEIYAAQAGVVLIHPFLTRYFERIGLVEAGEFVDTKAQHRAALLLHWLASGETDSPEMELSIHKMLCGIPLNYPLPRQWTIAEEERKEGENLLQAIVTHWGALGKVSNDSLREGFLLRAGKLSQRGGRWLLQPEQQTIDILLGKLPWGIGIIKLPWMPEMLTVEWS